ncbi:4'-phosphopantetheinyl transferase family protein [Pusillimonas minor]|uniref:4'-phosphopantetheinyl transferase superfamily protein n=1 Tax=Pusillimonas minor TaxID=2697024 RepID=A0A842HL00_9BURK|nr:4'-phosphopantetheinyl transferase superfamily protein [Pusillimonas minor]MBC2768957.1 4'-phosphopantetheinyl transferase superfamily protein [Pusillimonas minor]
MRCAHAWVNMVTVYVAPVPAQIAPEWLLRLSDAELARADRFVRLPDRLSYLMAHVLLQFALDAYCAGQACWRYDADRYGKPYLVSPRKDIHFNLSHTTGYVAVALSRRGPVGVDVESDARAEALRDMDAAWLSPQEIAALAALPPKDQDTQRVAWWVAKEALIKAVGLGLRISLPSVVLGANPVQPAHLPDAFTQPHDAWQVSVKALAGYRIGVAAPFGVSSARAVTWLSTDLSPGSTPILMFTQQ